jgi:protein phosphatase 1 regulatory subunit 11
MAGVTTTISTMVTTQQSTEVPPTLLLSLRPRSNVTWDEGVINNEGLGRKSSKRCCIFHKQRAFGESSTESSEDQSGDDDDGSSSSSSSGGGGSGKARRPMARKKDKKKKSGGISNKPKIPDHQRFHA